MNVDPTDPDTFEDGEDGGEDGPGEIALEAPEADTTEQRTHALRQREAPLTARGGEEADPADAAEQAREVEVNEDEYR
ncbi:hypothetical protein [Streptomyces sp. Z26]|uniref:hypothetical protein n=1 Tax=Streptomyces TaxID=1883 RepID=UPI000EF16942|nr:hypothetical protein [Streptomyces sp. Z26]RLL68781.1 hypothetical protein D7M15_20275 [Streptomyces sp. Z26]